MERDTESKSGSAHEVAPPDEALGRRPRRALVAGGVIAVVMLGVAVWQVPIRLPSSTTFEVKGSPGWSGATFVSDCQGGAMAVNDAVVNYRPSPRRENFLPSIPGAGGHGWLRIDHDWRDREAYSFVADDGTTTPLEQHQGFLFSECP